MLFLVHVGYYDDILFTMKSQLSIEFHPNQKKAIIIGQAPAENHYELPFGRTRLYKWFAEIGFDAMKMTSVFDFDALTDKFPGKNKTGHNQPSENEIKMYLPILASKIQKQKIKLIVPVGILATKYVMGNMEVTLDSVVGRKFIVHPFGLKKKITVIPLPHPSGISTWIYKEDNKQLLSDALFQIKSIIEIIEMKNQK